MHEVAVLLLVSLSSLLLDLFGHLFLLLFLPPVLLTFGCGLASDGSQHKLTLMWCHPSCLLTSLPFLSFEHVWAFYMRSFLLRRLFFCSFRWSFRWLSFQSRQFSVFKLVFGFKKLKLHWTGSKINPKYSNRKSSIQDWTTCSFWHPWKRGTNSAGMYLLQSL